MYDNNSRYKGLPTRIWLCATGEQVAYTEVVGRAGPTTALGATRVANGDRLDLIAWRATGDPTQFWKVADVNAEVDPFAITETPGRVIALPERADYGRT